ncbi:hypothetical protein [uncultured Cohaesibacter sp.]|uniref:hypothetical protein n=1 Tax=uncultured Cohaesibacter sp. TaxID=1002546 RepID=UPI0029C62C40|nr:hypothetical protein [uncultured Cohaesibacter sp.]
MMSRALKDLLPTVDSGPQAPSPAPRQVMPLGPDQAIFGGLELLLKKPSEAAPLLEPKDEQSIKTEAWSQGLVEAEKLWQEQKARDLKDLRAAFDKEKDDFAKLLHISLNGEIEQQFQEISARLADTMADLLEPFLEERACALMVRRFSEVVKDAMDDAVEETAILKGPDHLLEKLISCKQLNELQANAKAENEEQDGSEQQPHELSLTIDKTVFETRLKAFVAQLREAVQDE